MSFGHNSGCAESAQHLRQRTNLSCVDRHTWFRRFGAVLAAVGAVLFAGSAQDASAYSRCVAANEGNLDEPVPSWYEPGTTPLCDPAKQAAKEHEAVHLSSEASIMTAHWTFYVLAPSCPASDGANCVRTTPTNADYTANDCVNYGVSYCSEWITWSQEFYWDCGYLGAAEIAKRIRYWADRARANGPSWRVYTRTENGGYPWWCVFSVTQVP